MVLLHRVSFLGSEGKAVAQWPSSQVRKCLHRNYMVCNLKAFKRLLLSKVRLEVQGLEFHVTINQDCIATEIK